MEMYWTIAMALIFLYLGYSGVYFFIWVAFFAVVLVGFQAPVYVLVSVGAVCGFFLLRPLRRILSNFLMIQVRRLGFLPKISETERAALDAGTVWIERDIFSGAPNYKKLMHKPYPKLSDEEKHFLNETVEKLCKMTDDWKIWNEKEIPAHIWTYLKEEKFLGMIIPKKYGGLEFSAHAHSEVILKLTSRSVPVAISTMVPNSLGPAELLIHYGTEEQKNHYLPRLARGEDLPCFALTEPGAGSDAGSIEAEGVLFKGSDGKFYLKLNWNKRWITLSGIATVLGLAFRLRDPDNYLGQGEDLGITCALIPATTPGVTRNRRHDPMGIPFLNCPTQGKDVVVPAESSIIGGMENAGHGWKMLMECLAAGRGISLPAQATAGAKLTARAVGAHAVVRKQFGISVGKFEGVGEVLGRIAGLTYIVDALRTLTTSGLNQGMKPPVVTAITKYYATELSRKIINHGMDVLGGAGISRGPRNLIANHYISAPVAITVEGANILTRTLIVFGQGLFRAHPYAYSLIRSIEARDVKGFDKALYGFKNHFVHNLFRAPLLSLTRGRIFYKCPEKNRRYFQKLAWSASSFALTTDMAMVLVGPALKFKESLSGRFADVLAWNFIGLSVLYRHAEQGYPEKDQVLVDWSMKYVFAQMQEAFEGIYANLNIPGLGWFFKGVVGTWVRINRFDNPASDKLSFKAAEILMHTSPSRDRLTDGIYLSRDRKDPLGRIEFALEMAQTEEKIERKIRAAVKDGKLPKGKASKLASKAMEAGIISKEEFEELKLASEARWEEIQVDDFSEQEYKGRA